jgi:hypothetical protein
MKLLLGRQTTIAGRYSSPGFCGYYAGVPASSPQSQEKWVRRESGSLWLQFTSSILMITASDIIFMLGRSVNKCLLGLLG